MRKWLALLCVCCLCAPLAARAADTPAPIPRLTGDAIPYTPEGVRHYLLACADAWTANPANLGYTDGMVLATLDTANGRVMLTSFIRDMLIERPDGKYGRLNNVARTFGMEALMQTLNEHFGLRIEKYLLLDFQQVANIVDAVGGVDIAVTDNEAAYLRRYPIGKDATAPEMASGGTYHFTGYAAVIYMRIRRVAVGNVTGDFMRTQRVRTVLSTIADGLAGCTREQASELLNIVGANTRLTNMTAQDMLLAMEAAFSLRGTPVEQIRMPIDGTVRSMPYAGMATQEIDYPKNRVALHEFLFGPLDAFMVADE